MNKKYFISSDIEIEKLLDFKNVVYIIKIIVKSKL
jgi:hypothetical protein